MTRHIVTPLFLAVLVGCGTSGAVNSKVGYMPISDGSEAFIGYASMSEDRVLHVHVYDRGNPGKTIDMNLAPSHPNYEDYRRQADCIGPGETKKIRRIVASVFMNNDQSLSVEWMPEANEQLLVNPPPGGPPPKVYRPGEQSYDHLLAQVGGLRPGHGKYIYAGGTKRDCAP